MILFLLTLIIACQISSVFSGIRCHDSECCQQYLGSKSRYRDNLCGCADHYFFSQRDENSNGSCTQCPGIGESCADSQCCNTRYLLCQNDVCVCFSSEYCWDIDDAQRIRFERIAQCILGAALILTGTILLVLFWRTCSRRRDIQEALSRDRFPSLNSIQRFVLMQLQDRPPPYSHDFLQWKYASDIAEPPPSYIEAIGLSNQSGEDNLVFIQEEETLCGLSANSLLSATSTGLPPETSLESPQGAALNTNTLASTSQNPESNQLTRSTTRSSRMSHMSTGSLAENKFSETPHVVTVDTSTLASTSQHPESNRLTRSTTRSRRMSHMSTGSLAENKFSETPHVVTVDTSTLASTSQHPESNRLTRSTTRSDETSHMSTGSLAENEFSETCRVAPVDTSAFASTSGDPESCQLTRSNSGSGELTQFQEIEAPTNRLAHTQNDSDLAIPPTFHQSGANQSLVTTNVEIHM